MIERVTPKSLIVSLHDVTPAHDSAVRTCMDFLDEIGIPATSLLVVPEYHGTFLDSDDSFTEWLRGRRDHADEIVLHGWRHIEHAPPKGFVRKLRRALFTRGEGEFLGVSPERCAEMLRHGKEMLAQLDLTSEGFVAPAWLIEPMLYDTLAAEGFRYTTRQMSIVDVEEKRTISALTIVLRGSSLAMNKLGRFYNNWFIRFYANHPVLRVAIHPADIRFNAQPWFGRILKKLLQDRMAVTYGQFIEKTKQMNHG